MANPTDERPEGQSPPARPLDYVLVRHLARSPRTRTMRAARAGHRRQGVLLDDGTRIRKKGRQRLTELSLATFAQNHTRILEFVEIGALELVDPNTLRPLSSEELMALAKQHGGKVDASSQAPQQAPAKPAAPAKSKDPEPKKGIDPFFEEELRRMTRSDLNEVASSKYGVSDPAGLPNKQAVIDAIIAAAGGGE